MKKTSFYPKALYILSYREILIFYWGLIKMAEKVSKVGVKKESGYLYFLDKDGDVSRAKMARAGRKKSSSSKEKVSKIGVKKESGYLYFIDKQGDISRAKMARGRK